MVVKMSGEVASSLGVTGQCGDVNGPRSDFYSLDVIVP